MEAPELLNLKTSTPSTQQTQTPPNTNLVQPPTTTTTTPAKGPINKQIETRTSDGKRRITPMFIPPPSDTM